MEDLFAAFLDSESVDDSFFKNIIEKKLEIKPEDFKLNLVLFSPATSKNENFVASVYRLKIKLNRKDRLESIDVIVKVLLSESEGLKSLSLFPRERVVYRNVLRAFEAIWVERGDKSVQFAPLSFNIKTKPYEVIVLDDLQSSGYKNLKRPNGMNFQEAKIVLSKLAKFHASSVLHSKLINELEESESLLLSRKSSIVMKQSDPLVAGIVTMLKTFGEALVGYGDCWQYLAKIAKWDITKFVTAFVDVAEPMRSGFQVLNHGDLWMNNIMFNQDETDIMLIDFQLSYLGSPAGDLLYFLISSVNDGCVVEKFDELVEFYHQELLRSLEVLGYSGDVPTLEEIHADLLEKGPFGEMNNLNIYD